MKKIAIHGRFRQRSANGIDRTIEGHLLALVREGYKVDLLSFFIPSDEDKAKLDSLGVGVVPIRTSTFGMISDFSRLRGSYEFVMLHSVFSVNNWLAVMCLGCKWVITPHGGYSPGQIRHKRWLLKNLALFVFERFMLERALAVHVLSSNEAEQVKMVASQAHLIIAPNGADVSLGIFPIPPLRGHLRLLYIGRVECIHKGLDLLVREICELPKSLSLQLDIVGPAEPAEQVQLDRIIGGYPEAIPINFHGPLFGEDKLKLVRESHVFVHTSRWEGMPFSVVEALQFGRPVFISPGTNMGDLVDRYNAGWVVDVEKIGEGLLKMLKVGEAELGEKGENAARLAREELAWDKVTKELLSGLKMILEQKRHS